MKRLFLFEFATCGEKIDDSIAVEGLAMFKAALDGFREYYDVISFVRKEYADQFDLPTGDIGQIESGLENCDAFLIVAPEDENLLLELTKLGERYAENLGSSSRAIEIVSDKWKLYNKLKDKVRVPTTSKKPLECEFIVKPRISCAGEGIAFSDHVPDGYIAQEFIRGLNLSVSVAVGDETKVVSVNEQILNGFSYAGAVVPARISDKILSEVQEEAIKAVECIKGLNGYVGVDVVYSDQPYIIEINARLTTPVSAFKYAYGVSIAEMIKGRGPKFVKRHVIKKGMNMNSFYVRSGEYCLAIREM